MIVFIHYRVHGKDGVSLEIRKRALAFEKMGHQVAYIAGESLSDEKKDSTYIIPRLSQWQHDVVKIREEYFGRGGWSDEEARQHYNYVNTKVTLALNDIFKELNPELVFVHNLFSHAYNLPATGAVLNILDMYRTPTVVVNHDFWFERSRFAHANFEFVKGLLQYLPPKRHFFIEHQVINSLAKEALYEKREIQARQIHDYFDFSQKDVLIDSFNKSLPQKLGIRDQDFIVFQNTRLTPRKTVETAIRFCRILQEELRLKAGDSIAGKVVKNDTKVVLVLPNDVEDDDSWYVQELQSLALELGVSLKIATELFSPERSKDRYSFWDGIAVCDAVILPSVWEGYGHQFFEAVFAKKIPIIFEYPVFEADIKTQGYSYVSLGNSTSNRGLLKNVAPSVLVDAAYQTIELLSDKSSFDEMVDNNFSLAQANHVESNLRKDLQKILSKI